MTFATLFFLFCALVFVVFTISLAWCLGNIWDRR